MKMVVSICTNVVQVPTQDSRKARCELECGGQRLFLPTTTHAEPPLRRRGNQQEIEDALASAQLIQPSVRDYNAAASGSWRKKAKNVPAPTADSEVGVGAFGSQPTTRSARTGRSEDSLCVPPRAMHCSKSAPRSLRQVNLGKRFCGSSRA
jgi:hypothetical protein